MASVEDTWYRKVDGGEKVAKSRCGKGKRWRVRYRTPDGRDAGARFAKRVEADRFKATVEADKLRGNYVDPSAGIETFDQAAVRWQARQTTDPSTRWHIADRLRRYVTGSALGRTQLRRILPGTVQAWLKGLDHLAPNTVRGAFHVVSAVLASAVEDELIAKNPALAATVRVPRRGDPRIEPWTAGRVSAIRAELPERYRIVVTLGAGLGLRQGEIFGLAVADVDFLRGWVTVRRQVKPVGGRLTFAAPKGGTTRRVPLAESVKLALAEHLAGYPAQAVTLPWGEPDGKPATVELVLTNADGRAVSRHSFNPQRWAPARKRAGIPASRENGCHALRHYYASVLLSAGESVKAVSEYLGHHSAAITLDTYSHVMPESETRTRAAVDAAFASRVHSVTTEGGGSALTSGNG
jgi:integrase